MYHQLQWLADPKEDDHEVPSSGGFDEQLLHAPDGVLEEQDESRTCGVVCEESFQSWLEHYGRCWQGEYKLGQLRACSILAAEHAGGSNAKQFAGLQSFSKLCTGLRCLFHAGSRRWMSLQPQRCK